MGHVLEMMLRLLGGEPLGLLVISDIDIDTSNTNTMDNALMICMATT
jgi:hypothetical protein